MHDTDRLEVNREGSRNQQSEGSPTEGYKDILFL